MLTPLPASYTFGKCVFNYIPYAAAENAQRIGTAMDGSGESFDSFTLFPLITGTLSTPWVKAK